MQRFVSLNAFLIEKSESGLKKLTNQLSNLNILEVFISKQTLLFFNEAVSALHKQNVYITYLLMLWNIVLLHVNAWKCLKIINSYSISVASLVQYVLKISVVLH